MWAQRPLQRRAAGGTRRATCTPPLAARPPPRRQRTATPEACEQQGPVSQPALTPLQAEVLGRQALTAWNSRLWRRAQQAAEREPAAAAAAAAAALQLLPAARSGAANAGGGGLGVLVPWAVSECWLRPLLQHPAVAHAVAVEPSADGAEQISAAFALAPPNGVAHDGRERYTDRAAVSTAAAVVTAHPTVAAAAATTAAAAVAAAGGQQRQEQRWASKRLLLYRGNGFALTPPVLSLALDFTVVWDRWGLLLAPPPLRLHYLRTLSALLALPPGGAIVLAAHIAAPAQPAAAGEEQQGGAAGDEHLQLAAAGSFHSMCEAEVSELAAAAAGCAGLRLARRERLPAGALLTGLGRGAASGNTLLLFERC